MTLVSHCTVLRVGESLREGRKESGVRLRGALCCLHKVWVSAGNCLLSVCPVCVFGAWCAAECQKAHASQPQGVTCSVSL